MIISSIEKPIRTSWNTAKRYSAHFYNTKFPISGQYLVYVVVGRKWVRVTQGDLVSNKRHQLSRFRMSLKEWNEIKKEKFDE